jgi:hypothetical protein
MEERKTRKISNSMQRDVNYRRDTCNIMNKNSTGMPETVGMLATVGEAGKSRDARKVRNAGSQQNGRNTGNNRIESLQEY